MVRNCSPRSEAVTEGPPGEFALPSPADVHDLFVYEKRLKIHTKLGLINSCMCVDDGDCFLQWVPAVPRIHAKRRTRCAGPTVSVSSD